MKPLSDEFYLKQAFCTLMDFADMIRGEDAYVANVSKMRADEIAGHGRTFECDFCDVRLPAKDGYCRGIFLCKKCKAKYERKRLMNFAKEQPT